GGSVKDRIAKFMLEDAEKRGVIKLGITIIEPTSGNTGIGLAMLCAQKGYDCEFVMPEYVSVERRKIISAYGARVTLTPADEGIDGPKRYVKRIVSENPDKYFSLNQYENPANWQAHYFTTADEILADTDGKITHFVAGLGTSGTLMGVSRRLKEANPNIEIIAVESEGTTMIQGLRNLQVSQTPSIFDSSLIDNQIHVSYNEADCVSRRLAREEGIFVGKSSGAAVFGALELANELHESGIRDALIVVLLPDSGERYLSESFYAATVQSELVHRCITSTTLSPQEQFL
ncbi:MAG: PLP-dependent cysteine synthase family protein, partial [Promethearchaeota archaeon]